MDISNQSGKDPSSNIIGDLFWPFILLLKFLGYCPLTRYAKNESPNTGRRITNFPNNKIHPPNNKIESDLKFGIILKSKFFLWSLLVCLFFSYSKLARYFGWSTVYDARWRGVNPQGYSYLKELYGEREKSIIQFMDRGLAFVGVIIPFSFFGQNVFSWLETKSFCIFLNRWEKFQQTFSQTFPPTILPYNIGQLRKRRNILYTFYVLIPSLTVLLTSAFSVFRNDLLTFLFSALEIIPFFMQSIHACLLEDLKVLLTYDCVADAFVQIGQGIQNQLEHDTLTPSNVRAWRELVQQVRQQVLQAGKYQKGQQLFLIGTAIMTLTALAYLLLSWIWLSANSQALALSAQGVAFVCVLILRLYLKILGADKITKNELRIVQQLQRIDTSESEFSTQIELKFIHDMIKQDPSRISFGSYVTLNKGLLLGIFSQVVTYLIVLMQFTQSKTVETPKVRTTPTL